MVQNQKFRASTSLGRRSPLQLLGLLPERRVVEDVVGAVGQHHHPADTSLGHGDAQVREAHGTPATTASRSPPPGCWPGTASGNSSKGGSGEGMGAQPDEPVCRQRTVPVSSQAARKGSHCRECRRRQAELGRDLGEAHRLETPLGVAPNFLGRDIRRP